MDNEALRLRIQRKLRDGRLPHVKIPRVWGSPSAGETCDVCDMALTKEQLLMEGTTLAGGTPIQFHVRCFMLWDDETRKFVSRNGPLASRTHERTA